MALELKQSLSLNQQLIMTPQLQQAIKLLQLSRLELLETINQEMEENPLLEEQGGEDPEGEKKAEDSKESSESEAVDLPEVTVEETAREDVDWENYLSEYNSSRGGSAIEDPGLPSFENVTASKSNLYTHLLWQLNMVDLDDIQREIGAHIIGNLDEDGYLEIPLKEIAATTNSSVDTVAEVQKVVQTFDPIGVAANDCRECLLIQIKFNKLGGTIAERIISEHLNDLENKRYENIAKELSVPLEEVLSSLSVIQTLEPKPGRTYIEEETIYVSPDIYVFKVGDNYEITLNEDGLPKLRISGYYRNVLSNRRHLPESTKVYLQEKLKSAAWLIKSIHQRQRTIYRVTESIVRFQRGFLDNGITQLKPLVLRDVAEDIQMHESTISRVTTNKYVYTAQGVFELKYFFNSAISTLEGDAVASESVKERIRNIIKWENKAKPLSDQEISDMLRKLNINVARRTVAKYRETMGLLTSRKRRQLF